jgi:hypothetical protein
MALFSVCNAKCATAHCAVLLRINLHLYAVVFVFELIVNVNFSFMFPIEVLSANLKVTTVVTNYKVSIHKVTFVF